jgi:rSAM/selenodomain-associated transferase 1
MDRGMVILLTKPAVPGRVKTRLIGELTPEEAARLHAAFVNDLLSRLDGGSFDIRIAWALEDHERPPRSDIPGIRQRGRDLGERLFDALLRASREASLVAAIGSDHPELSRRDLESAFADLEAGRADVVIGPALDGGYYLLALRSTLLDRELFRDIPWSSSVVLERTLERCRELGLRVRLLEAAADVDTPEDLEQLGSRLGRGLVGSPETEALLRSWGRLPAKEI